MKTAATYAEEIRKREQKREMFYVLMLRTAAKLTKIDKELRRLEAAKRKAAQFERRVAAAPRSSLSSAALADR